MCKYCDLQNGEYTKRVSSSLGVLGDLTTSLDISTDGEDVEFIIDNYERVLCNRTKTMSKPTYYANDVIAQIDNWYEEMGYEPVRNPHKNVKQIYDRFETALNIDELAELILRLDVDFSKIDVENLAEYLEKKDKYLRVEE